MFDDYKYKSEHSFLGKDYWMVAKEELNIFGIEFTEPPFPEGTFVENTILRLIYKNRLNAVSGSKRFAL